MDLPNAGGGERLERLLGRLGSETPVDPQIIAVGAETTVPLAAVDLSPSLASDQTETAVELAEAPAPIAAPTAATVAAVPQPGEVEPALVLPAEFAPVAQQADVAPPEEADVAPSQKAEAELATIADTDVAEIVDAAVAAIAEAVMATQSPAPPARPVVERPQRSSPMRVIAVCSQKGGSGKTTLAGHLAVQAGLAGHGPAVLIDTDPQGSLAEWWRARTDEVPALATVRLEDLAANLQELQSYGTEIVIIDTPPALTASIEEVIAVADLVIIPARPSPHDLRAVGATVELVRRAGKPFVFVLNGAAQRANITVQAVAALSEHGRVSPVILYQRTEYAASMIDGRTVTEAAASGKSAQEIAALWKFIEAQVGARQAAAA